MASQSSKISNKKPKLVRDSFTIPKNEFAAIDTLKNRAIALGTSVKKSELLRAGLMVLQSLSDAGYKTALAAVPTLKTGRPATAPLPTPSAAKASARTVTKDATKTVVNAPAKAATTAPARKAPARKAPAKTAPPTKVVEKAAARRPAAGARRAPGKSA